MPKYPRSTVPAPLPGETSRQYLNRLVVEHHLTPVEVAHLRPYAQANVRAVQERYYSSPQPSTMPRGLKPWGRSSLRSTQMSLAQRQAYIRRRQAQMGWKVTSFAPTSRSSAFAPETKYFDTSINASVTLRS